MADINIKRCTNFDTLAKMNILQSPILFLVPIALAVVLIFVTLKNRIRPNAGFKDIVKNPQYWKNFNKTRKKVESDVEASRKWDEAEIAAATRDFVMKATSSREAWSQGWVLRELGERTHPTVLGLLRDSILYSRLVEPTGTNLMPEAPFNRACDLLGDAPGDEAVEVLAAFLNDPSNEIRKNAALSIAKTGAATITPLIRKALSDPDEYVRSYALMGLDFALSRSGLHISAQEELFPDLLKLLRAGHNADKAAKLLYRFEPEKAKNYFLSQEVFTVASPILHKALEVLANAKVPVPHGNLKALITSLETHEIKYPITYALGEALRLLGQQQREEDRAYIHKFTTHPEEQVAEGASEGLLCAFGLDGFKERLWDTEERSGYDSLTENQRFYSAVFMFDAEILNGGLAQFFVNSSGDRWQDTLAGLKAMGFQERLAVLSEALAKFGSPPPSTDRDIRQDQLSKLYKNDDTIFDSLDTRYYDSSESFGTFATRFVLNNPEDFR